VDPRRIVESNAVLQVSSALAELLDLPVDEVAVRVNRPNRRFEYVKRFVHQEAADELVAMDLQGVFFRDATVRFYPHKSFMCHVLGFVNHNGEGCGGVEQAMDSYLKGSPGWLESSVDAFRRELYWRRERYVPALQGADVELTVDQNIQYMVEKALDRTVETHHAVGAWAIVQRVHTGEILAMASRPCFNINEFLDSRPEERLNRAIGQVYEPGSTFKAAVIAAAFNEGTVDPSVVFDCENGAWYYKGRILHDYHAYDRLTVADGLQKSSNILTAKVALTLGDRRIESYLRRFGIGSPLGIDLPGEEAGILHPCEKWSGISATRIAIGQGVAVTALQMLGVYCAIANDGFLMRPYVVRRVKGKDGTTLRSGEPEVLSRPITSETARLMMRLLARVTEDGGTGKRARVDGYRVAGKTGSAQKPVGGRYSNSAHVASFVGFLPALEPEIAIIVVVDEPQPLHTGGVVAAPAFQEIASDVVRYLDIPPGEDVVADTGSGMRVAQHR
jgi:cell division protein FtsI (penicillin-binding protein 3)